MPTPKWLCRHETAGIAEKFTRRHLGESSPARPLVWVGQIVRPTAPSLAEPSPDAPEEERWDANACIETPDRSLRTQSPRKRATHLASTKGTCAVISKLEHVLGHDWLLQAGPRLQTSCEHAKSDILRSCPICLTFMQASHPHSHFIPFHLFVSHRPAGCWWWRKPTW